MIKARKKGNKMKGRLRNVKITEEAKNFSLISKEKIKDIRIEGDKIYFEEKIFDDLVVEICSGTGDFLTQYAFFNPETLCLGIDYAENAIFRAVKKAYQKQLDNCKFCCNDANAAIDLLKLDCATLVYINFPDPWPKRRHEKRRLVTDKLLYKIYNILKKSGKCIIITDNEWYKDFIDYQLRDIKLYRPYYSQGWFITDNQNFCDQFPFYESGYFNKAKSAGATVRFYVLDTHKL